MSNTWEIKKYDGRISALCNRDIILDGTQYEVRLAIYQKYILDMKGKDFIWSVKLGSLNIIDHAKSLEEAQKLTELVIPEIIRLFTILHD